MAPETIGKYRVVRLLGKGGMGTVYEAFEPVVERRVAIKVLHPEYQANSELAERFLNEARAANRIGHPGVIQVSECAWLDDGTVYLVMEYLDGQTLTQRLRQHGGQLPLWMAIDIAIQIADTLCWGHEKGIIHRDLKPDNVMIIADPVAPSGERIKLFDFGIAKVILDGPKRTAITQPMALFGTVGYMPPEQLRGAGNVVAESDVYSLGVIIFQMIAGRRPFMAESEAEVTAMVLRDEAPLLTEFVPETAVPEALVDLLRRMLANHAMERPPMPAALESLTQIAITSPPPTRFRGSGQPGSVSAQPKSAKDVPKIADTIPPTQWAQRQRHDKAATGSGSDNHRPIADAPQPELGPSTFSQANGQRPSPGSVFHRLRNHRAAATAGLGTVLGLLVIVVLWRALASRQPVIVPDPPPTNPYPGQKVPPPPVAVKPPTGPGPTAPPLPPVLPDKPKEPPQTVARQPPPKPILITPSCILSSSLSFKAKKRIAASFARVDITIYPNEQITLIRQGSKLVLHKFPPRITNKQDIDFERIIGNQLGEGALPDNLKRVDVSCFRP